MSMMTLNRKIKILEIKIEYILLNDMNELYDEKYKKEFDYFSDKLIRINKDIELAWKTLRTCKIKALSIEKNISKNLLKFKTEFNEIGITTKSFEFCEMKITEIYDSDIITSTYNETVNKYFGLRKELE